MATSLCRKATCDVILLKKSRVYNTLLTRFYSKQVTELFPQRLVLPDNHGYVPTLSPDQVSNLLGTNETSLENNHEKTQGFHVIKGYHSNQLGSNYPMEDRRAQAQLVQTDGALFGVFDGHGGIACAQAVSERLFDYIAVSLLPAETLEKYSHALKTDRAMDLIQRHHNINDYFNHEMSSLHRQSLQKYVVESLSLSGLDLDDDEDSIKQCMKAAFRRFDSDLSVECLPVGGTLNVEALEVGLSGACGCVAHVQDRTVRVANVGDTRAILGQFIDNEWVAKPLSEDHNTSNPNECDRVQNAHPLSEQNFIIKNNRLLGTLIPLRAFGDFRYKWGLHDLKNIVNILGTAYAQTIIPMNYYTPPYLIAKPQVMVHDITPQDRFLVLASDGLWELLSNEDVVQLVSEFITGRETDRHFRLEDQGISLGNLNKTLQRRKLGLANKSIDTNVATHLIRNALGKEHRKVSEMLTLPPEVVRYYRDDISVTVIFFDPLHLENHS